MFLHIYVSLQFGSLLGVVKISTCTLYAAQLQYQTVGIQVDYTYTEKYPDPNVVTVAL